MKSNFLGVLLLGSSVWLVVAEESSSVSLAANPSNPVGIIRSATDSSSSASPPNARNLAGDSAPPLPSSEINQSPPVVATAEKESEPSPNNPIENGNAGSVQSDVAPSGTDLPQAPSPAPPAVVPGPPGSKTVTIVSTIYDDYKPTVFSTPIRPGLSIASSSFPTTWVSVGSIMGLLVSIS